MKVALLTGGDDRPYIYGLVNSLLQNSIELEVVGGDGLHFPEWREVSGLRFLNLRKRLNEPGNRATRFWRFLRSYGRLLRYTWIAKPAVFHIIWNNKFEYFDRTVLMAYYRWVLGKKVVFTAHNVNKAKRDRVDTYLNRLTLKLQYSLCNWIFVHTDEMKSDLVNEFHCDPSKVTVIPFGINNSVPVTSLTLSEARKVLGIGENEKTILFFGRIVPYKGLEYLVSAFQEALPPSEAYRLIVVGRPEKDCMQYFNGIQKRAHEGRNSDKITWRIEYIPDAETEIYFKAAHVLVLPYRHIYQSGVLFIAYNFGLPVIASDVGGLRSEIIEGQTGFLCKPEDPSELARVIKEYFGSDLFMRLNEHRARIQKYAHDRYSWDAVGVKTVQVYAELVGQA
jgi:D-inositol-3-phosphate glycosyltransferase